MTPQTGRTDDADIRRPSPVLPSIHMRPETTSDDRALRGALNDLGHTLGPFTSGILTALTAGHGETR